MRSILFLWILFGLLFLTAFPVRAEFDFDNLTMKFGATEGKEIEKDLYCYIDWRIEKLMMELTNRLSWPRNNLNYSKFNLNTYFEDYEQLKLEIDYQWNDRYRILSPEISYYFIIWRDLTIRLDYENQTRTPVLEEDRKMRYSMETGTVKMEYEKQDWNYLIKLSQTRKSYPDNEIKDYDKNRLDQELTWRVGPNLKLILSYFEVTGYYPYDINIYHDYWKSETGIVGEYRFNDRWRAIGSFSAGEEEKRLEPYLLKRNMKIEVKNKLARDLDLRLKVGLANIDYYSELPYIDPDDFLLEDDDQKSRAEKNAVLECRSKYRRLNLTVEVGLFWVSKQYDSSRIEDSVRNGLYSTICWNPGKFGIELELAPEGNIWRKNGFYQLKLVYRF